MRDSQFGHLRGGTGWTEWDYVLIQALRTIEDNTDDSGLLIWERESDRVDVQATRKVNPFKRAIDAKTKGTAKKPYKPLDGEYFTPDVKLIDGDEWPTYREYIDNEVKKAQDAE